MSRNLGRTDCCCCEGDVVLVEAPRPVKESETGAYWDEFKGMLVANAECPSCLAQYLTWVTAPPSWNRRSHPGDVEHTHFDLSFRHSFNDEPDERDLPRYEVEIQRVRTGPFKGDHGFAAYLRLGKVPTR